MRILFESFCFQSHATGQRGQPRKDINAYRLPFERWGSVINRGAVCRQTC